MHEVSGSIPEFSIIISFLTGSWCAFRRIFTCFTTPWPARNPTVKQTGLVLHQDSYHSFPVWAGLHAVFPQIETFEHSPYLKLIFWMLQFLALNSGSGSKLLAGRMLTKHSWELHDVYHTFPYASGQFLFRFGRLHGGSCQWGTVCVARHRSVLDRISVEH